MNIIDAVESGKNFRRISWNGPWLVAGIGSAHLNFKDILATDWEIEEKKIEITESEFDAICQEVYGHNSYSQLKKRLFK